MPNRIEEALQAVSASELAGDGVGSIADAVIAARFVRAYPPAVPEEGAAVFYLPFIKGTLVTEADFALADRPPTEAPDGVWGIDRLFLGLLDGRPCVAYRLPADVVLPETFRATEIRALYGRLPDDEYALAGYALQLLGWRDQYRFCSRCGTPAHPATGTWGMECPACGLTSYPPVSPAILVLIHDGGDRTLLATKPGWGTRYSIVAGFTEPGESLEGCAVREILEEVGVHARDLVYDGSQPWPFPHQIMIGFTSRWIAGDIKVDETELAGARWFRYDALPDLPGPLSLSRQIIDRWVASRQATNAPAS